MRITIECGFHFFFFLIFFRLEENVYSSITKRLSKFRNILNLCPKIQKHQQMLPIFFSSVFLTILKVVWLLKKLRSVDRVCVKRYRNVRSKFTKPLRITFECGFHLFFLSKIADYIRVRIKFECGLFSSELGMLKYFQVLSSTSESF